MTFLKRLILTLEFFIFILACIFIWLVFNDPDPQKWNRHLLELTTELLALAILVMVFEKYSEVKSEKERSSNIRLAAAWLLSPNTLQLDAKAWVESARNTRKIPNRPMPFNEVNNFYYKILLLAVESPNFIEFSYELRTLKDALAVSNKWDNYRSIHLNVSQINHTDLVEPILKEVESAADKIKEVWLPYEVSTLLNR
jgi:hypothetical protein